MEEDIKILEHLVEDNKTFFTNLADDKTNFYWKREQALKEIQAIENLINKYKEQEKIIELMNEYILNEYISPEICNKHTPEDCYADIYDDNACRECVLDYFRKKAKGE